MNAKYKKTLKIVTLLITAAFIATASADIYNYLFQDATIAVEGLSLTWTTTDAADATDAGTTIEGSTCTLPSLKGPAGGTRTYSDPVRLTASAATTFNLNIVSVSGISGEMDSLVVKIYDITDDITPVATLTVWNGVSQGSNLPDLPIAQDATWRFQWEISWSDTATGPATVNLEIEIPPA